jgi:two-component system, OmpR family, sensor kinase
MRRPRLSGLRARLLLSTLMGSLLAVSVLVGAFNLVLDGKLRGDVDNLLRDRAAAQLRTVAVIDGRISVPEAPDKAAPDTETWIFAGPRTLEQPVAAPESQRAALALNGGAQRFLTVEATDTRLHAVPIVERSRRLGTLVVGASLNSYESSAHTTLVGSLILGILTVLGIAAISAWVIRRALAPVARMTAAAADWGEHDLSRRFLVGEPHDELTELAATFDRLLERLSQSLRREQRFTAEISHELRTPLAKILAEAELTPAPDRSRAAEAAGAGTPPLEAAIEPTPARYRRALESIRVSAGSLGRTLDTLLATARSEIAEGSRSTEARAVAEQAARDATNAATVRGITIQIAGPPANVRVAAEFDLVQRALAPLIENAIRFARGRVDVSIRTDANQVVFEVHDDGPGVEPTIREQIFEPGVSTGGNGAGSGAGLGLPLARRLAYAGGGDIDQVAARQGATFSLRLPAA